MYWPYWWRGVWTEASFSAGFTPAGSLNGATDGSCQRRAEAERARAAGARAVRAARRARRGVLLAIVVRGGSRRERRRIIEGAIALPAAGATPGVSGLAPGAVVYVGVCGCM